MLAAPWLRGCGKWCVQENELTGWQFPTQAIVLMHHSTKNKILLQSCQEKCHAGQAGIIKKLDEMQNTRKV